MEEKVWDQPKICFRCKEIVSAGENMYPRERGKYVVYVGDCCKFKKKRRLK